MAGATKAISNPHGANQYRLDPRQSLFLAYYLDPKSKTYGVAKRSALLAGYEETYAANIMDKMPTWLLEKVESYRATTMLEKAERNLEEMLDMQVREQAMGAFGPLYEKVAIGKKVKGKKQQFRRVPVLKDNLGKIGIKAQVSQFIAKSVGRKKYGSDAEDTTNPRSIMNVGQIIINAPQKAV